jgi:hypothetical protein
VKLARSLRARSCPPASGAAQLDAAGRYLHWIRRFGRLGRVLERNATENRLDCWRRYVTHDLARKGRL